MCFVYSCCVYIVCFTAGAAFTLCVVLQALFLQCVLYAIVVFTLCVVLQALRLHSVVL